MLGFLKRMFRGGSAGHLLMEAHWCSTPIKLPQKLQTPLGSNVTVVTVCVDIQYSIDADDIMLRRVTLARNGGSIMGSNQSNNIASDRTGEAWYASSLCPERDLAAAVEKELSTKGSRLRKLMIANWRDENRPEMLNSLADALNSQSSSAQVAQLIANVGRGNDLAFTYTKPNGECEDRFVTIEGVSGESIRALDHKDRKVKSFRIDRITNARRG